MNLEDHPTVRRLSRQAEGAADQQPDGTILDGVWLRRLALDCGADDAGLVEIARPALDLQRDEILRNYPWTRSLLGFVVRIARAQQLIRETSRSQIEIALEVATPVRAISRRSSGGKPVLRPAITGGRSPVSSRQGQHQAYTRA